MSDVAAAAVVAPGVEEEKIVLLNEAILQDAR